MRSYSEMSPKMSVSRFKYRRLTRLNRCNSQAQSMQTCQTQNNVFEFSERGARPVTNFMRNLSALSNWHSVYTSAIAFIVSLDFLFVFVKGSMVIWEIINLAQCCSVCGLAYKWAAALFFTCYREYFACFTVQHFWLVLSMDAL